MPVVFPNQAVFRMLYWVVGLGLKYTCSKYEARDFQVFCSVLCNAPLQSVVGDDVMATENSVDGTGAGERGRANIV